MTGIYINMIIYVNINFIFKLAYYIYAKEARLGVICVVLLLLYFSYGKLSSFTELDCERNVCFAETYLHVLSGSDTFIGANDYSRDNHVYNVKLLDTNIQNLEQKNTENLKFLKWYENEITK